MSNQTANCTKTSLCLVCTSRNHRALKKKIQTLTLSVQSILKETLPLMVRIIWRTTGNKDTPSNWRSPQRSDEKSPEQGKSYSQNHWGVDARRKGVGGARTSDDECGLGVTSANVCSITLLKGRDYEKECCIIGWR